MGFDYDHVKFDEIGKDLKVDPVPKVSGFLNPENNLLQEKNR
jgi:hypothetical protein